MSEHTLLTFFSYEVNLSMITKWYLTAESRTLYPWLLAQGFQWCHLSWSIMFFLISSVLFQTTIVLAAYGERSPSLLVQLTNVSYWTCMNGTRLAVIVSVIQDRHSLMFCRHRDRARGMGEMWGLGSHSLRCVPQTHTTYYLKTGNVIPHLEHIIHWNSTVLNTLRNMFYVYIFKHFPTRI